MYFLQTPQLNLFDFALCCCFVFMEALRESHVEMWSSWGKDVKFIYV